MFPEQLAANKLACGTCPRSSRCLGVEEASFLSCVWITRQSSRKLATPLSPLRSSVAQDAVVPDQQRRCAGVRSARVVTSSAGAAPEQSGFRGARMRRRTDARRVCGIDGFRGTSCEARAHLAVLIWSSLLSELRCREVQSPQRGLVIRVLAFLALARWA